jgi:hypothetical protein
MGASLADYARIQLLSFLCPASVPFVFAISFCFVRAYKKLGSPGSSLSCEESVLCCTGLPGVECAASCHEDFVYVGFICSRCEEDGLWRYARVLFLWHPPLC